MPYMKDLTVTHEKIEALIHPVNGAVQKVIDHPVCCMEIQSEQVDEHLFFMTCETVSKQAVRISMDSEHFAGNIGIGFLIDGQKIDYLKGWSSPQKMVKNKLILCYAPIMSGYAEFSPNSSTSTSGLYLPRTTLLQILKSDPRPKVHELFAPIFESPELAFYLQSTMTPAIVSLLQALQRSQQVGFMNAFARKAQVYQLLQLTIERIIDENCHMYDGLKLTVDDVLKLQHAQAILDQDMQNPPSLAQLASLTRLNEFKLKRGFKQLFNKTIYQYLYEVRMQRAAHLCLNSDLSIIEISHEVGYCNHGHFSIAFRKMYGQAPSKYRKQALQSFHFES